MKELSASELTSDALTMLRAQGARVRRVNNIPHNKRFKHQVEPGNVDIQGYTCKGLALYCEVKTINDRLSKEQKELLLDLEKCGGLALVATQVNGSTKIFKISEYLIKKL